MILSQFIHLFGVHGVEQENAEHHLHQNEADFSSNEQHL